jgi:hypothetical protein
VSNVRTTITRLLYVALGAIAFSAVAAVAATTIGTNIQTDGTLNVGGFFGISTTTPGSLFSVGGITNFTAATSTFYSSGGINLTHGCFAVNGTCVGDGGGTTPSPLPFFGNQTNTAWVRPSLSTFSTWLNQTPPGLATATADDGANGLPLIIQTVDDGSLYQITGLLKSMGPPPWTITVALAGISNISSGAVSFYPIVLRNSVSDKAVALIWWGGNATVSGNGGSVQITHWTNVSSGTSPLSTPGGASNQGFGFPFPDYIAWFRIHNDGTNLTFSISQEGALFLPLPYTETLASFIGSVDQVGFGVDRLNDGNSQTGSDISVASALWSWVETSP